MYDIIVLTETHLDHGIGDSEIFPNYYTVFRRDTASQARQGGVVLIILQSYTL